MAWKDIGKVIAVCRNNEPGIPKYEQKEIRLISGLGIEDDYHAGKYIRHRYLAKKNPNRLNNRQVLIVDEKTIANIALHGIQIEPGQLGENILVSDIDLMRIPIGKVLKIGKVTIELSEIRQPCNQLNVIHPQLMNIVMPDKEDPLTFNAGMLGIIMQSGIVTTGNSVSILF
jgi:MOSC domain-containing protein YiiM